MQNVLTCELKFTCIASAIVRLINTMFTHALMVLKEVIILLYGTWFTHVLMIIAAAILRLFNVY